MVRFSDADVLGEPGGITLPVPLCAWLAARLLVENLDSCCLLAVAQSDDVSGGCESDAILRVGCYEACHVGTVGGEDVDVRAVLEACDHYAAVFAPNANVEVGDDVVHAAGFNDCAVVSELDVNVSVGVEDRSGVNVVGNFGGDILAVEAYAFNLSAFGRSEDDGHCLTLYSLANH